MDKFASRIGVLLYAAVMVATVIGVDIAFLRGRFWERLAVNIGIVLLFAAFYVNVVKPHLHR